MQELTRFERLKREQLFRDATRPSKDPDEIAAAFELWCREFVKIETPDGPKPFLLRPSQRETVRNLAAGEDIVVLKSRQTGFSTLFANWAMWLSIVHESHSTIFLSVNQREARMLLRKAKFAWRRLPQWVKSRLPHLTDNTLDKMAWENDSYVESLPSQKDAARGRTVRLLIADEFASLEDQEEAWAAMLPATTIGGQVVVLSTAKGAGDLFEQLWNRAVTKAMDFVPLFWSWREAFDDEWYERQKEITLPWILAQEYPSNAEEAFVRSGNAVFDTDRLREMVFEEPMAGEWVNQKFKPGPKGPMSVWLLPEEGTKYVIGVDVAEGLEHGDRTVIFVLRVPDGAMAARWMGRVAPHIAAEYAFHIGHWYNRALIAPERNNHGHAFILSLNNMGYWPIYQQQRQQKRQEEPTEQLGWLTTPASKAHIINQLDLFTQENNLVDEVLVGEMRTFVRNERGKMGGSPFDDNVMAFAIAVEMLAHAYEPKYRKKNPPPGPGTYGWYERISRMASGEGRFRIGGRNVRRTDRLRVG